MAKASKNKKTATKGSKSKSDTAKTRSVRSKVKQQSKTPDQRIDVIEGRVNRLELLNIEGVEITFDINFYGGAGGVSLRGENLREDVTCNIPSDYTQTVKTTQSGGPKNVYANGEAPNSQNGRIEIQVSQNDTVLSKFSENVYTGSFKDQIIYYTIQ